MHSETCWAPVVFFPAYYHFDISCLQHINLHLWGLGYMCLLMMIRLFRDKNLPRTNNTIDVLEVHDRVKEGKKMCCE